MKNRSTFRLLAGITMTIILSVATGIFIYQNHLSYVVTINGDKIFFEEFQFFMKKERASVISEFQQLYGNELNKSGDHLRYKRKEMINLIFQRALQQLIQHKVQWQQAKLLGLAIQNNQIGIDESIRAEGSEYLFFTRYYTRFCKTAFLNQIKYGPIIQNKEQVYSDLMHRIQLCLKVYVTNMLTGDETIGRMQFFEEIYIPKLVEAATIKVNQPGAWLYFFLTDKNLEFI